MRRACVQNQHKAYRLKLVSDRSTDILITAFGPFPGVPRNPSACLSKKIASDRSFSRLGLCTRVLVMPTAYMAITTHLRPALAKMQPRAVLMLGVAARRRHLCIERLAVNRASRLMPDASGQMSAQLLLEPGGPPMRNARAPLQPMLRAMKRAHVPARMSRNAGRYLCNAAYFAALAEVIPSGNTLPRVAFIHVPMPQVAGRRKGRDPRPTLLAMTRALLAAAHEMLRGAPAARLNTPDLT